MGLVSNFFNRLGGAGGPQAVAASAPATAGVAYTLSRLLGSTSTLSLISGTNGNLTLSGAQISQSSAIVQGSSQTAVVREYDSASQRAVEYPVTLAGTAVAPAVTPLPQQSAFAARFHADAIPVQADGSTVASWTDSVGGQVASQTTDANKPVYKASGANGKPYLLLSGNQWLDAGSSGPVQNAVASGQYTVLLVYRNISSGSGEGYVLSMTNGTGWAMSDKAGSLVGFHYNSIKYSYPAQSATALRTLGYAYDASTQTPRLFAHGTCLGALGAANAPNANLGIGGAPGNPGATCVTGELYDIIVWNKTLTTGEMLQAEKWARDKYGVAYPWTGSAYRVLDGDSITAGQGASSYNAAYPSRVAAAKGWALGTWSNVGKPGQSFATVAARAANDVDSIVAQLGSVPLHVAVFEWYNERNSGAAAVWADAIRYMQGRRSAGVSRIIIGTSTPSSDGNTTAQNKADRNTYNTTVVNGYANYADALVSIHSGQNIGVDGASDNTTYFNGDKIHLTNTGYQSLADLFAAAFP